MDAIESWMRNPGRARLVSGQAAEEPPPGEATPPERKVTGMLTPGARSPSMPRRAITVDDWLRGWIGEKRGGPRWEESFDEAGR